ncbi:MAG: hypothetical protein V4538_16205 [Bacteroidota bacterium]
MAEKSVFSWLKEIKHWEKSILWTAIFGIITTLTGFAYSNFSLPKDDKRIEVLERYIETDKAEKAVMKENVVNLKENLKELKVDMKEGFKSLSDKMDENIRMVRIVKENTK